MNDPLRTYLHDHLAGSGFAVELLETLANSYPGHETGTLASEVLQEVRADRRTLETIIERVGKSSPDLKDASMWVAEKASRAKLHHNDPTGFGAFEAMEAISLGIMGKLALWHVLVRVGEVDKRVAGFDYGGLAVRAKAQFDRVEDYRVRLGRQALQSTSQ
jgi:hypothetical protein